MKVENEFLYREDFAMGQGISQHVVNRQYIRLTKQGTYKHAVTTINNFSNQL